MKKYLYAFSFALIIVACSKPETDDKKKETVENPNKVFQLIDSSVSGLNFSNLLVETDSANVFTYEYLYNGSGVGLGDINNDGLQDVFLSSNFGPCKLFLNKGDLKFEDITNYSGIQTSGFCTGVTMADVNNDGLIDIYVCRSNSVHSEADRTNLLFVNRGDNKFEEQSKEFGLDDSGYGTVANFFDYDLDGDLDMFLANHPVRGGTEVVKFDAYQKVDNWSCNKFFVNNGNINFTENTSAAGLESFTHSLSVSIMDFNNDGLPDIYSASDYHGPDLIYLNKGDGTFEENQQEIFKHTSYTAMGSDAADFDNNGLVDLITLDMLPEDNFRKKLLMGPSNFDLFIRRWNNGYGHQYMKNTLQQNLGEEKFSEIGTMSGVHATDWSWAPLFADFDNDGWKDLFVTNGYYRDITSQDFIMSKANAMSKGENKMAFEHMLKTLPKKKIPNYMYRNNKDLTFSKVTNEWGFSEPTVSSGAAYGDLDNDGDLDLIVCNTNQPLFLYENVSENRNSMDIRFVGSESNINGIGCNATLYTTEGEQYLENYPTRGYCSSVSPVIHFGLGTSEIDSLRINWPSGKTQLIKDIARDTVLIVKETEAINSSFNKSIKPETPLFTEVSSRFNADIIHKESAFLDFKSEPLVPQMFSKRGPDISVADVNNDGLDDFILSGSAISRPQLMIQGRNGKFKEQKGPWNAIENVEETVVYFFDSDGDEFIDLYIGNGSNEFSYEDKKKYQDQIYRNNGGNFELAYETEFAGNTASVVSHDFDSDGDQDLFIASGVITGMFPLSSPSHLLINDGGTFIEKTKEFFPSLKERMLCNQVVMSDIYGDSGLELIIVGEWMPITVYSKSEETWNDITAELGLDNEIGWWKQVEFADLDNDGDLDMVVGNEGLNSQYNASKSKPLVVDFGYLDENKKWDAIISQYTNWGLVPIYAKNEIEHQMKYFISSNYKYYSDYASSSTSTLLSNLNKAERIKVTELRSSVFINTEEGFKKQPLTNRCQVAPIEDIESIDINGDGNMDLLMVGNNYNNRIEYGWTDALNGLVLLGDGKGGFDVKELSGFYVPGNGKNIETIEIGGKTYFIVSQTHDKVRLFESLEK